MKGKVNLVAYDCQKRTMGLFFLPWGCCSWIPSPTSKTNYSWEYVRMTLKCGFDINDASMMLRNTHMTLAPQVAKRSHVAVSLRLGTVLPHLVTYLQDLGSDPTWGNKLERSIHEGSGPSTFHKIIVFLFKAYVWYLHIFGSLHYTHLQSPYTDSQWRLRIRWLFLGEGVIKQLAQPA